MAEGANALALQSSLGRDGRPEIPTDSPHQTFPRTEPIMTPTATDTTARSVLPTEEHDPTAEERTDDPWWGSDETYRAAARAVIHGDADNVAFWWARLVDRKAINDLLSLAIDDLQEDIVRLLVTGCSSAGIRLPADGPRLTQDAIDDRLVAMALLVARGDGGYTAVTKVELAVLNRLGTLVAAHCDGGALVTDLLNRTERATDRALEEADVIGRWLSDAEVGAVRLTPEQWERVPHLAGRRRALDDSQTLRACVMENETQRVSTRAGALSEGGLPSGRRM